MCYQWSNVSFAQSHHYSKRTDVGIDKDVAIKMKKILILLFIQLEKHQWPEVIF